ncbi:hypothetical protein BD779DRAFT_1678852 [Infundibulicybe gibba]|nr:hypothetical protein BD779DRAFT_1678852 [Infundibulicybe gibba]
MDSLQLRLGARPGAFSMRLRVNKVANFVVESAGQSKAASNQGICRGDKMATQGGYPQSGKEFEEYDSPELMVGGSVGIGLRVDVGALIERGAGRNLCPEFDLEALDVEPTDAPLADGFSEEDRPLSPTRLWATEQQGTASPVFTPTPTPLTTPTPELTGSMQTKENPPSKKRKNKKANGERAKRRKEDSVNKPYDYLEHLAKKQRRFIQGENAVHTLLDTLSLPHASSGFVGRVESSGSRAWTLDRVRMLEGFAYKAWKGILPEPICDGEGRVVAVLAGRPNAGGYLECTQQLAKILLDAGSRAKLSTKQKRPGNLVHNANNTTILESVMSDPNMRRVAGFGSASFALWAPKLFRYYRERLELLYASNPQLRRLFPNSIFTASTLNCGPQTASFDHVDSANLPFGWCSITALGDFNPVEGGHMVLWDARLVIEFPAGSTILIPSGSMRHSNTTIGKAETRLSFTQFCAGSLFRWVEYGFQTAEDFEKNDPVGKVLVDSWQAVRWSSGVELFSKLSDLVQGSGVENIYSQTRS